MSLHCKKCLTGRTGDVLGAPCKSVGCGGVIEEEPLFRDLVDELPEPMTCGRRADKSRAQDRWQRFKSNGNRVCSYCGSLHPDDWFELVRACVAAPEDAAFHTVVEIEPSHKSYKIYVSQPGVRNAMEGGIKFYTPHLPRDAAGKLAVTPEQDAEYKRAVHATKTRFQNYMALARIR